MGTVLTTRRTPSAASVLVFQARPAPGLGEGSDEKEPAYALALNNLNELEAVIVPAKFESVRLPPYVTELRPRTTSFVPAAALSSMKVIPARLSELLIVNAPIELPGENV